MLSDILLLQVDGTLNPEQQRQLKIIKQNSETLLSLPLTPPHYQRY